MLTLYLDYELDDDEQGEVERAVGQRIELVRVPWLFPLRESASRPVPDPRTVRPHLERVGIERARGNRVLLVAPGDLHWYASLAEAIEAATGCYPLLVQPEARRREAGCPGPLRILDMEAYLRDTDGRVAPPWLQPDGPRT